MPIKPINKDSSRWYQYMDGLEEFRKLFPRLKEQFEKDSDSPYADYTNDLYKTTNALYDVFSSHMATYSRLPQNEFETVVNTLHHCNELCDEIIECIDSFKENKTTKGTIDAKIAQLLEDIKQLDKFDSKKGPGLASKVEDFLAAGVLCLYALVLAVFEAIFTVLAFGLPLRWAARFFEQGGEIVRANASDMMAEIFSSPERSARTSSAVDFYREARKIVKGINKINAEDSMSTKKTNELPVPMTSVSNSNLTKPTKIEQHGIPVSDNSSAEVSATSSNEDGVKTVHVEDPIKVHPNVESPIENAVNSMPPDNSTSKKPYVLPQALEEEIQKRKERLQAMKQATQTLKEKEIVSIDIMLPPAVHMTTVSNSNLTKSTAMNEEQLQNILEKKIPIPTNVQKHPLSNEVNANELQNTISKISSENRLTPAISKAGSSNDYVIKHTDLSNNHTEHYDIAVSENKISAKIGSLNEADLKYMARAMFATFVAINPDKVENMSLKGSTGNPKFKILQDTLTELKTAYLAEKQTLSTEKSSDKTEERNNNKGGPG